MKNINILLVSLIAAIVSMGHAFAETTILRAACMIDVASGDIITPAVIVIEDGIIDAVNPETLPDGAATIDLGDRTLLPGMMVMHSHVTLDFFTGDHWTTAAVFETPADWALYGVAFGQQMLDAGFKDAYRELFPDVEQFPGFTHRSQSRIDQLYYKGTSLTNESTTVLSTWPTKFPSDHFLIKTVFSWSDRATADN